MTLPEFAFKLIISYSEKNFKGVSISSFGLSAEAIEAVKPFIGKKFKIKNSLSSEEYVLDLSKAEIVGNELNFNNPGINFYCVGT